ncbi:bifunctional oligoribonuclease/PAP phosphatase NrnA [Mesonia sp. HuA40]|uniref:DHH family phosphoesterase n=1 Tax=Mesonia sp. HuA40 TaxID=2602761 RepID=UPI0011C6E9F9|nr:bifunctional oligoribonuclease/PAP phosphatase NrnA [Mesonia sp. HuA40]TXK74338.1 bifunctional oligoribonuclease/PAP phosphatase NrnA [Mesonia sp. HuA40]
MTAEQISEIKSLLANPRTISIIPHRNPDGDALGSTLALKLYLEQLGHTVHLISPNLYPDFLSWLPHQEEIILFCEQQQKATQCLQDSSMVFTLDFNDLSRTGEAMQQVLADLDTTFVMIDHHQAPADYARFTYSDVNCSSTCEMVFNFLEFLGDTHLITEDMATCLYTGIMTDTGSFRFSSTTSRTHKIIARLIDAGANNTAIHNAIYDSSSSNRMQLLGVALSNMKILPAYKTAYISLSQEELDQNNFKKGDTEGFVNYGLAIKGIIFAAIFIENKEENIVKISLRSKGDFDVNQIARKHFQGGGHINAAGGKSDLPLSETLEKFEQLLPQLTHE